MIQTENIIEARVIRPESMLINANQLFPAWEIFRQPRITSASLTQARLALKFSVSSPLANLRKFAGAKPKGESLRRAAVEQCELCSIRVPPQHRHLLEMTTQKIVCSCDACALRFQDVVEGRFKLIPRDARELSDFAMADADWENFALPINLAFFFYSTPRKK